MKRRLGGAALSLGLLCLTLGGLGAPALAHGGGRAHAKRLKVFEACRHGCRFHTIQRAVDAAGAYQRHRHGKSRAVVAVRPGRYAESVVLDGALRSRDFDGLTIEGTKRSPRRTILEGHGARGGRGAAGSGIEAFDVTGLVLRNLWARNYPSDGFAVHSSGSGRCGGYLMENLLASGNGAHGFFARRCLGGRMIDSAAWGDGDSAFFVGETPCDRKTWTDHGLAPPPAPCQRRPKWTLLKDDRGFESALGYSGANSKYVKVVGSAFYDNGAGILSGTTDAEGYEPNGWSVFERNQVFWNNYDFFLPGSRVHPLSPVLAQLGATSFNYPIGVGVVLYGGAGNIVRANDVFGNYKWGVASFSGPTEAFGANEGDDAKNIDNQIAENTMGREGADPNGEYDFFDDGSGGGNCWGGNSPEASFAPGSGKVPLNQIYPPCPQPQVLADRVSSLDLAAGLQVDPEEQGNPRTIIGYATQIPPQRQECSWARRITGHPPFQTFRPLEVALGPAEATCG